MIGCSESCRQIEYDIQCASKTDAKVLISGESGVGKEVVARLIHERSLRQRGPMVAINCASIPDTLLASELFGHMKGSFTDAHRSRTGLFEQGHRGTVFLDEVGEMSLSMQALVLRFLENGEILPVGSERLRHSRRRAHHRGDQSHADERDQAESVPRGPLLPPQRHSHRDPAAALAAGRRAAAARRISCAATRSNIEPRSDAQR